MKNFYREGRGLSILKKPKPNNFLFKDKTIVSGEAKQERNVLTSENRESYAAYLSSLIYEYQLHNKYATTVQSLVNREDNTRESNNELFNKTLKRNCLKKEKYNKLGTLFLISFFTICCNSLLYSAPHQGFLQKEEIRPLNIGDNIPEALWHLPLQVVNHPAGNKTIRLSDYKDKKLIILDFWATWCGGCIGSISNFLQSSSSSDIDVFFQGVTYQEEDEIKSFEQKSKHFFPSIISDNVLSRYFPYRLIPHVILIKEGKVLAITDSEILKADALSRIMKKTSTSIIHKVDILDFDKHIAIKEQSNAQMKNAQRVSATLLKPIRGLGGLGSYTHHDSVQRLLIINKGLLESMYLLLEDNWRNRIFLDFDHKIKVDHLSNGDNNDYSKWVYEYGVGIEFIATSDIPRVRFNKLALDYLLLGNGYSMEVVDTLIDCYVISNAHSKSTNVNKNDFTVSFKDLLKRLNHQTIDQPRQPIFILDDSLESQLIINIDLQKLPDLTYLENSLVKQGYQLRKQPKVISIIRVREEELL
ncbi:peroxiredoxin family protein [Sphingobacterium litopenaei]|uniref:TlpA family protein disulfide reductase n=1 Tax=Sphingobacterium litopenaei TaxID=2763500 RepID=A0ABR7YBA9_9SPHI|nr:TlpA disulfide reductase family protein [Sphingobacterium litopenaei]MBD1428503.1 TlpA family protein disulfide reductase [Sphingobacterium litopenaei]